MTKVIVSLVATYILNIVDYLQTIYAVRLCDIGVEANPIGRLMLENNCGWVVKFIIVPVLLLIIGITVHTERKWSWAVYAVLIFYTLVVLSNFNMLYRIGVF